MTPETRVDKAILVDIYRRMALIQRSDERFRAVIKSGKIVAPYYSPRGQEAIPAAVSVNLTDDDTICTIYRGIHDMLAKGVPSKLLWAEIAGKATGTCKGKGGPMHITHPQSGVMVTTGIVGSSMPIANGLALAAQIRGEKRVAVAYFGDGASNIGAFHEALNRRRCGSCPLSSFARTTVTASTRATNWPRRPSRFRIARWAIKCQASRWTATTHWRCMPLRAMPWHGRVPVTDRH